MRRSMIAVVLAVACSGGGGGGSPPAPDAEEEPPRPDAAAGGTGGAPRVDASLAPDMAVQTPSDGPTVPPDATGAADTAPDAGPPTNPFVYVGSEGASEIRIFQLDLATGALMPRGSAPSGNSPDYLAFHPNGRFVYALNEVNPGRIVAFSVDRATGMLTRLNDASSGGDGPAQIGRAHV